MGNQINAQVIQETIDVGVGTEQITATSSPQSIASSFVSSVSTKLSTLSGINGVLVFNSGNLTIISYSGASTTGNFVLLSQTGQFYPTTNPSGFITGIDLSFYVTHAQTGQLYPNSNPSGFITGVDLSSYVQKSQTGQFLTTGYNPNSLYSENRNQPNVLNVQAGSPTVITIGSDRAFVRGSFRPSIAGDYESLFLNITDTDGTRVETLGFTTQNGGLAQANSINFSFFAQPNAVFSFEASGDDGGGGWYSFAADTF